MSTTTTLPPANSHFISTAVAADMTARFRESQEIVLSASYKNQNIFANSETFNRDVFDEILSKPGCAGIRIYYGMDPEFKVHAIIVGADAGNSDILPKSLVESADDPSGYIGEEGQRCPTICPPTSPLNP